MKGLRLGLSLIGDNAADPARVIDTRFNTSVDDLGGGVYRITKTAGGNDWNADATSASVPGNFVLRMSLGQANMIVTLGMSDDPTASVSWETVDRGIQFSADGTCVIREDGGAVGGGSTYTTADYHFIRRIGTGITLLKGATTNIADATLVHTYTALGGALCFDSSFFTQGAIADVSLTYTA